MRLPPNPKLVPFTFCVWCTVLLIVFLGRILSPSDLGQNIDQSKTIAFTLDMVRNNHWILPQDSVGNLAHKPPMINWIGAPIVALGFHCELALKLPVVLAALCTSILVFFAARFLFRRLDTPTADPEDTDMSDRATALAWLASAAWIASPSAIKHCYFMRPDMLFTALLTAGWFASFTLLVSDQPTRPRTHAAAIWVLTALAILTKGPLALGIPIYLVLHILIISPSGTRRTAISRTGWWWGVPIMVSLPMLWLWAAYNVEPDFVRQTLLGQELGSRITQSGGPSYTMAALEVVGHFFERFAPWCIPAVLAILMPPTWNIRRHPLAPASLWLLIVLTGIASFRLVAGSYIMPAYPAGAILAVHAIYRTRLLTREFRKKCTIVMMLVLMLVTSTGFIIYRATTGRGARTGTGEHLKEFAREIDELVGRDPIRFHATADLPLVSLLARHQSGEIHPDPSHRWLIQPTDLDPHRPDLLRSQPIGAHDPITGIPTGETFTLSLYPLTTDETPEP